jgi:hypothetical protein
MLWAIGFLILAVFLAIPILAIVLDSPLVHRLVESRRAGTLDPGEVAELKRRLAALEDEMDDLGEAVRGLKDENQFLQRLLESVEERSKLPPAP